MKLLKSIVKRKEGGVMRLRCCFCLLLLIIAGGLFVSCSTKKSEIVLSDELLSAPLELDIFAARGFLGGSEYERYHLSRDVLWRECGAVTPAGRGQKTRSGLEGDEVFHQDPTLTIEERRIDAVPKATLVRLKEKIAAFAVNPGSKESYPLPGGFFSLKAPGLFELKLKMGENRHHILTSVDAVSERDSAALSRLYEIFAAVRGVGPVICGSKTFFGIERKTR